MARFPAAVAAMYAAHSAKMEAQTPGLRCPGPTPHETCDGARQRLFAIGEQFHRIRSDARDRAVAAGWPGVTLATPLDVAPFDGAPDPIGDFLRAERDALASALASLPKALVRKAKRRGC